jgi:hypothetical protein
MLIHRNCGKLFCCGREWVSVNRSQVSSGVIFMLWSAVTWRVNGLTDRLRGAARFHWLIIAIVVLGSARRLAKDEKSERKEKGGRFNFLIAPRYGTLRLDAGNWTWRHCSAEPDPIVPQYIECNEANNHKLLIFNEWGNGWLKNIQLPPSAINTRAQAFFESYQHAYPQKLWKTFLLWAWVGVSQS